MIFYSLEKFLIANHSYCSNAGEQMLQIESFACKNNNDSTL